jgi:hypothetical protein
MLRDAITTTIAQAALAAALAFGFAACASGPDVSASVAMPGPPTMVEVAPGVWTAEDYDYPVYYSDGFYWSLRDDVWYRSPYWDRGFAVYPREQVPAHVVNLRHDDYRRYRAPAEAERVYVPRGGHPHAGGGHHHR